LQQYSAIGEGWKERDAVKQEQLELKKTQSREASERINQFVVRESSVAETEPASLPHATQLEAKFGEEEPPVGPGPAPEDDVLNLKIPANVNVASNDVPSAASSLASVTGAAAASGAGRKRKQAPSRSPRGRGRPRLYPTFADLNNDPGRVVGRRIARYFDNPEAPGHTDLFSGTVHAFRMPEGGGMILWDAVYDDGDEESLDAAELIEALKLYQKSSKIDSNPDAAAVPSPGAGAANAASQRADDEKEEDAAVAAAVAIAAEGHSNDDGGAVHPESSSAGAAPLEPPIE
jgi:hypothetical protein